MSEALRVEGVGKNYGQLRALADVSFTAGTGELVSVIGPNGAGKTTLLSIIAGAQPASAGSVTPGPSAVGWAPQQPALYTRLTVAENLALFARLERVADVERTVAAMLEQTGLAERADERVGALSGGNRQRVNVALGLLAEPPVIVLDEPSASLDPAQRERLWVFIRELAGGGRTVLFSTHNVDEAERHADRALVLVEGRMCFDGTPRALRGAAGAQEHDFESAFVAFLRQEAERTEAQP